LINVYKKSKYDIEDILMVSTFAGQAHQTLIKRYVIVVDDY